MVLDFTDRINRKIEDSRILKQGYQQINGFIFKALVYPANIFDAIVVHIPPNAHAWGNSTVLSQRTLAEHIEFINIHKLDKAIIIAENLYFLTCCPSLKHLCIIPADTAGADFDYSPLYDMPEILSLTCATEYGKFLSYQTNLDYSRINGLQSIQINSGNHLCFEDIPTLRSLALSESTNINLNGLFSSKYLDTLSISTSKIRSLLGIEHATCLQCLYLSYNRSLCDIQQIESVATSLRALRIEASPKIHDFSVLKKLKNLEYLCLKGNNVLSSLCFLKELPKLKTLIFDMDVKDGDLTPCLDLGYVHCSKFRKHYNLKAEELPKTIFVHGNEGIDLWRRLC